MTRAFDKAVRRKPLRSGPLFNSAELLRKSQLRVQAQPAPAAHGSTTDGLGSSGKKDDEDHQQGNGSRMHTPHPQLPEIAERPSGTSAKSSRRGALDIPSRIAAKEGEAVINPQIQFMGN